jgi:PPP family 3-phenylpropionic acid transporter
MPYDPDMGFSYERQSQYILSGQYFLHFAVMGGILPYFNLYCYHLGLTGFQIGTVSALRSILLVVFSLIWSGLADRFSARKPIFVLCLFASTGIWVVYFYAHSFKEIFLTTLVYGIFYSPVISFLEAFTIDWLGADKPSYGRIRAWGSISFIMMVILLGEAIDRFSIPIIIPLVFIGSLFQSVASVWIPVPDSPFITPGIHEIKRFITRPLIRFLCCAFLMLAGHGAYYGFFSIHLEQMGFSKVFIGTTWAIASASEILVMVKSKTVFSRYSLERILAFSFFVATLRWISLIFFKSPLLICISQITHAVTYGAFHVASILYIDSLAPLDSKTLGQAVNNAVTYGLGLMGGFLLSGILYAQIGTPGLFAVSGFITLLGGVLFLVLKT